VKRLLSGNEAVARGAWEADVAVASAYPGTPSTEIMEEFARYPNVYAEWAPNEKVAVDVVVGAAYAGRRALAAMKHVGVNVAADSVFYASMTGVEAGLVIVTADDPDMHSSQNEQDNRRYAKFARIPCLEPSDSQEAKDLVGVALDLSEQFDTPVFLRMTTRICHSSTPVELGEQKKVPPKRDAFPRNPAKYVMVPGNARKKHPVIEERIRLLADYAETFPFNRVEWGAREVGIVTCGVAYQYAREVLPGASYLRLGMTYPLPPKLVRDFASQVDRLIVIEELDPFLEEEIKLLGIACEGKSFFPKCGEFDPRIVREGAVKAGLLPESARQARDPTPSTGPVPRLPAPRPLSRAQQTQGAGDRRYRLLHAGPGATPVGHPHLRLHGSGHRPGSRCSQSRPRRADGSRYRRLDLLSHRAAGAGQCGVQPEQRDHRDPRQPHHWHDRPPAEPRHRPHAPDAGDAATGAGAPGPCPRHWTGQDGAGL
jgi:indolepyruvate ferredoxin oxidoreductase alpha subunit